jgi:hypothetical protein
MLFGQIDQSIRRRIEAEIKVDLKIASATLRKGESPTLTQMAKLKVVEKYIAENNRVGTIGEPGIEYFYGNMDMQWGLVSSRYRPHKDRTVFFRGRQDGNFVVLAGSAFHMLGNPPSGRSGIIRCTGEELAYSLIRGIGGLLGPASAFREINATHPREWISAGNVAAKRSMSHTAIIIAELLSSISAGREALRLRPKKWIQATDAGEFRLPPVGKPGRSTSPVQAAMIAAANEFLLAPAQRLEFLAVPLAECDIPAASSLGGRVRGILGTPIYVAISRDVPSHSQNKLD